MLRISGWGAACCCWFLPAALCCGAELPLGESPLAALSAAALIEQLDSVEFSERQAASESLRDAGLGALSELEQVALSGSREASARAFEIFKEHRGQGDAELQRAVNEILLRIAAAGSSTAAQRARQILNPPKPETITMPAGQQFPPPPPGRGNFGFVPAGFAPPNAFRRVSISDVNGRRTVEIDDRERRVKLSSDPAGAIQAEVSEVQNGRNITRTIDAKNLDELQRKDGELARLYQQYYQPGPGQAGGIGPAAPFGFIQPRGALAPGDLARRQLESIDNMIQQHKQRAPGDPNALRMIDFLERARQQIRDSAPPERARALR